MAVLSMCSCIKTATLLFSVDRENVIRECQSTDSSRRNVRYVTGLTFAAGDTISFIVGNNENVGGDETALQAAISVETDGVVVLGDANCDGEVNFLDISPFIVLLSNSDFKAQADIDGNDEVDFLDIAPFIAILSSAGS